MKRIFYIILSVVSILAACKDIPDNAAVLKPINYIVLLDLSDRLLVHGQVKRDINIIESVYFQFCDQVRKNLVINSKDKFQVLIATQQKINYNPSDFQDKLYIDMGIISPSLKLSAMEEFSSYLDILLNELYTCAYQGDIGMNYMGSNIWQFFNDKLSHLICPGYDNILLVLTDGYFDFEDYSHELSKKNRYPTSSFLNSVRGKIDWEEIIIDQDMGLIPIQEEFRGLTVCVAEINPKYNFQYEYRMLEFIWGKWCSEMKVEEFLFIPRTSIPQTENLVSAAINNRNYIIENNY